MAKPHQLRKKLDQPRGLYEPRARGDAWGADQIRTLKRNRTRRLRRLGKQSDELAASLAEMGITVPGAAPRMAGAA